MPYKMEILGRLSTTSAENNGASALKLLTYHKRRMAPKTVFEYIRTSNNQSTKMGMLVSGEMQSSN